MERAALTPVQRQQENATLASKLLKLRLIRPGRRPAVVRSAR